MHDEGYRLRGVGQRGQWLLAMVSALGIFVAWHCLLKVQSLPDEDLVGATVAAIVMLGIPVVLSLWGLRTVAFGLLARWHIGPDGLRGACLGMTRHITWSEVCGMDQRGSLVSFSIAGKGLLLRSGNEFSVDDMARVSEFWSDEVDRSGLQAIPLVQQSIWGTKAWLGLAATLPFPTLLAVVLALAPKTGAEFVWAAVVLTAASLATLGRAVFLVTESVTVGRDVITRASCFRRTTMPYEDVRTLEYSRMPNDKWGMVRLATNRSRITFRTTDAAYEQTVSHLRGSCVQAALLDGETGDIRPPENCDPTHVRNLMISLCRRARRRYLILGTVQIICLPLVWVVCLVTILFMGLTWFGTVLYVSDKAEGKKRSSEDYLLYDSSAPLANFRRARQVKRSYDRYISTEG